MFKKCFGIFTFVLLASAAAMAARAKKATSPSIFDFQARMDSFAIGDYTQINDSTLNPQNLILRIPDYAGSIDLRPEFKLLIGQDSRTIVRPRLISEYTTWQQGSPKVRKESSETTVDLTDAYTELRVTDSLRMTAGLEVYQWGPAELYNASNPLFHLRTENRSPFFKEKGAVLARVGLDLQSNWNTMIIANPISNNEPAWRSGDEDFKPSAFLKTELTAADNPATGIGLLGGNQPDQRAFFGEYASYAFESGISLYMDARHPIGKRHFTPVEDQLFNIEIQDQKDKSSIESLAVIGARWEGRVDVRVEYFYNSQGFTHDEFDSSLESIRALSVYLPQNYARLLQPGLEILGQHTLYVSVRVPDLTAKKDASFFIRSLFSLQDYSSALQTAFEKPLSDSLVFDFEGNLSIGPKDSEMTLAERYQVLVGLRWSI